jgi:hypothetical protein
MGNQLLPSRSKNAYFESYKISAKPREIKACGILQSGRFMSEKGVMVLSFMLGTYLKQFKNHWLQQVSKPLADLGKY